MKPFVHPSILENDIHLTEVGKRKSGSPVVKLSLDLGKTYGTIDKISSESPRSATTASPQASETMSTTENQLCDDQNNDLIWTRGDIIDGKKYTLLKSMGKGTFGQVVKSFDNHANVEVAIKIIKNHPAYLKQAKIEVSILERLMKCDPTRRRNIVHFERSFEHMNHLCLVFELLAYDLYTLLNEIDFAGFPLALVKDFSLQLLSCLSLMALPEMEVIHCDLKPENILVLSHEDWSTVKLIDFGSSCISNQTVFTYVQSRFYRAPEVILEIPYTKSIDMWSLACVIVEMVNGHPLFPGKSQKHQMSVICSVLGLPEKEFVHSSRIWHRYFYIDEAERLQLNEAVQESRTLESVIIEKLSDTKEAHLLIDLLKRMLTFDPTKRISPDEAIQHPFFSCEIAI